MKAFDRLLRSGSRWVERRPQVNDPGRLRPLGDRKAVWIAWEEQRRTSELAQILNVPLERLIFRGPSALRYPVLAMETIAELRAYRPDVLIVQNPSIVLTFVAVVVRRWFGLRLVVDRHTNFMLNKPDGWKKTLFTALSRFTLRGADLTIVTNRHLVDIVDASGGRGFALPDRIPDIAPGDGGVGEGPARVCFVCTYAQDEPWVEVARAAADLYPLARIHMTGSPDKVAWPDDLMELRERADSLVVTGFLPEHDYVEELRRADVVMDLTTFDHCLVCGAYEAVAAGAALVLSNKAVNAELFGEVAVLVDPDRGSIAAGVRRAVAELEDRRRAVADFRGRFRAEWDASFSRLCGLIKADG